MALIQKSILLLALLAFTSIHAWADSDEITGFALPLDEYETYPTETDFEQSIGFYSNGNLIQATSLPNSGQGFLKIFRPRDRAWANESLIRLVIDSASTMTEAFPRGERLQIGDFSQKEGGKITLHASHQNGLDVDIAYFKNDRREQAYDTTDGFDETFVKQGKITSNFDITRNWEIVKLLVSSGKVGRIFVGPVIKRTMCDHAKSLGEFKKYTETLRKLRPLENHDDHFHVRITCPAGNSRCQEQAPPAEGDGCSEV